MNVRVFPRNGCTPERAALIEGRVKRAMSRACRAAVNREQSYHKTLELIDTFYKRVLEHARRLQWIV